MLKPLPPLNALRAFEATARHLSFTRAADELAVINELDVLEDLEFLAWMEEEASSAASS